MSKRVIEVADLIEIYARGVGYLREYDDREEVTGLLIYRDTIAKRLQAGAEVTDEAIKQLAEADDRLIEAIPWLEEHFPEVFRANDDIPRRYWWWHLDEGPQVREEAEKTKVA